VVKYKKNGTVIYTSSVTPTYPLLVDTALWSNGATLNNVVISGNLGGGSGGANVHWLVADHLGTPRMIVDQTGTLANLKRHDYLPFGEELFGGTAQTPGAGGRLTDHGYTMGDSLRHQFTSKERDVETGLDYFQARYYSNIMGRFTSVDPYDPITVGASNESRNYFILQPQNWNRYTYGLNNPQKYVDPDGETPLVLSALGGAIGGAVIGGGIEAAKALYRGESLTDPAVLRRIGAKAANGAIFGAVVGLTGNAAAGSAAISVFSAAAGSVAGGVVERAVDGDDSTEAFSATDIGIDALAGASGGFAGHKVTGMVNDMTYALRQSSYEAFEQLSGGPLKTLEREALKRALRVYKLTYNPRPGFVAPERLAQGAARGATRAGITFTTRFLLNVIMNQREEQKRQQRTKKDCSKGCVTVTATPI
jgi:RHS repeat-associated protein